MGHTSPYSKPPIAEALVNLAVEPIPGLAVGALLHCHEEVAADYPTRQEFKEAHGTFHFGSEVTASASTHDLGYTFGSTDQKRFFQVRTNGVTVNRLAPYPGWGEFGPEARRLWEIYRKIADPQRATVATLRYINRIDLPVGPIELRDYFQTLPEVGRSLPQLMEGFLLQVRLPIGGAGATVNIILTPAEPAQPNIASVILDLEFNRPIKPLSSLDDVWAEVEAIRAYKNDVFESCITEKTRELIR